MGIVISSHIRKRIGLKNGDSLLVLGVKDDIIIPKKINVEKILRDIARKVIASKLDLDTIAREIEEEANKIAGKKILARH